MSIKQIFLSSTVSFTLLRRLLRSTRLSSSSVHHAGYARVLAGISVMLCEGLLGLSVCRELDLCMSVAVSIDDVDESEST